ncbi:ATP-binding cassette domain-containing protein [Ancylobacter terrae]|uniref:ATP-binding cassette domain-containing protein n=1 Tax=Ancylobacter sp. sgz301288 TaxID=3342077 RepID=UPI00385FE631
MTAAPASCVAPPFRTPSPAASHGLGVHVERLSRRFGEKRVLERLDLAIPAGQFVAVIGKSGCGKSTLLRLIGGLDEPSSGSIAFDGGADREAIRLMFQEPRLLPWQRVGANVEVGLPRRTPAAERAGRARAILGEVGLADRVGEWPAVLSGGQKQRVALARALASRPRLLALDEPLGALDALTRIEMQGLIERIWLEQRFTALLVTHDVAEALALADRVILIDQGRIAFDLDVPLPRPRRRGSAELAALEERLLSHLFAG